MADAYMKALLGKASTPPEAPPAPKLSANGDSTVADATTGLMWLADANVLGKVISHDDGVKALAALNADKKCGHADWRMPTRDELLALAGGPGLPKGHPFENVGRAYLTGSIGMKLTRGTYYWQVDVQHGIEFFSSGRAGGDSLLWPVRKAQ